MGDNNIVANHLKVKYNLYKQLMNEPLDPEEIRRKTRDRIITSANEIAVLDLQTFLNSIFYPSTSDLNDKNSIASKIQAALKEYIENLWNTKVNNFNFNWSTMSVEGEVVGFDSLKMAVGRFDRDYDRTSEIKIETLRDRKKMIEDQIIQLTKMKSNDKIQETLQNLQALSNEIQLLLNQYPEGERMKGKTPIITLKTAGEAIRNIDKQWDALTCYSKVLPKSEYGPLFEKILTLADNLKNNLISDSLKDLITIITEGEQSSSRGQFYSNLGIPIDIKQEIKYEKPEKNKKTGKVEIKTKFFTLNSIFLDKQQKMDVKFNLPFDENNKDNFRISVKNWGQLDSLRDFGKTSLLAGLMRSGSFDKSLAYAAQVSLSRQDSQIRNAHNFAKACIFVDIVIGLSQQSGYADTIVINNRAKSQIEVYSVKSLLNKFYENISNTSYFNGYDFMGKKDFMNARQPLKRGAIDQLYQALAKMKAIEISVGSNLLTE